MTQTDLAKYLGVPQNRVSRWEDGILIPSESELEQIGALLEFPVDFFVQTGMPAGFATCCLYHRKRKTLPITTLHTIHDRINVARFGLFRMLRNISEFPLKFDPFPLDEFGSPEHVAEMVRALWRLPVGPIRNLVELVESAGGLVIPFDFETDRLDAVSLWPAGMPPLFFLSRNAPADRSRWNLAHELGHIFMHGVPTADAEDEADRFASEFLMPSREVSVDLNGLTLAKAAALKLKWRVSMQALMRKAKDVGRITPRQYTALYTYMSSKGYRKVEPVQIDPEEPSTLKRLVELHFSDLKYTSSEVNKLTFCLTDEQFNQRFSGTNHVPHRLRIVS